LDAPKSNPIKQIPSEPQCDDSKSEENQQKPQAKNLKNLKDEEKN
jgi:hypothetical protein